MVGRPFLKGNAGGPGRPPLLPDAQGMPEIDATSFRRLLAAKLGYTREDLETEMRDPRTKLLDIWLCKIAAVGIKEGDWGRLEGVLNRLIGRVKETVDNNVTFRIALEDYTEDEKLLP